MGRPRKKDYAESESGSSEGGEGETGKGAEPTADLGVHIRFDAGILQEHGKAIYGCAFSPYVEEGPPILATAAANRVTVYSAPSTGSFTALQSYRDPEKTEEFYCVAWLYDEVEQKHLLAAAGLRGLIRILSPAQGLCTSTLIGHGHAVNELRLHPHHSTILMSASHDYTVRLWNARLEMCLAIVGGGDGHIDQVLSCDMNLDGSLIVSCSMDHSVKLWSTGSSQFSERSIQDAIQDSFKLEKLKDAGKSFKKPAVLQCPFPSGSTTDLHRNYVDCVRFAGLRYIISKSCDQSICVWKFGELVDDKIDPVLPGGKAETNVCLLSELVVEDCDLWFLKFAVHPKFKMIAAGNKIGKIFVWPIAEDMGDIEPVCLTHRKCRLPIRQVEWSPCGRVLVAVCDDATIWRWNVVPKK